MMTKPSSRMVHSSMSMPAPFASTMLRVTTAVQRKSVTPTWCVTKIIAQYMKNLQSTKIGLAPILLDLQYRNFVTCCRLLSRAAVTCCCHMLLLSHAAATCCCHMLLLSHAAAITCPCHMLLSHAPVTCCCQSPGETRTAIVTLAEPCAGCC